MTSSSRMLFLLKLFIVFTLTCLFPINHTLAIGPDFDKIKETIKKNRAENKKAIKGSIKGTIHELISNMPQEVLDAQGTATVNMPTIAEAIQLAQQAASEASGPLIDQDFHQKGAIIKVPSHFPSIRQAIAAAKSGDTVLVAAGIYFEQIVMKDGVKLLSDSSERGNDLVPVENARIRLPRRTLRTIIDGSKTTPSKHGMVDFNPGVSNKTIIDGFTIRNLPHQNHHIPGHAHGLNVRGASPVIMNCYIKDMGSTGIGSHVVYNDQQSPLNTRDFRSANIKNPASAVIYNNIISGSLGLGIGCNHFASPTILGNEIFDNNDSELGTNPSPGMGNTHGSHALIIGNIVHDNPGGGILAERGKPQGQHPVDRTTHPTIIKNVVYDNGPDRPGIASWGAGSVNRPVVIQGNYVYNSGVTGIALAGGGAGTIEDNMVSKPNEPGIAINDATALKLNRNQVTKLNETPGIIIIDGAVVHQMVGNRVDMEDDEDTIPYLLDGESTIKTIN